MADKKKLRGVVRRSERGFAFFTPDEGGSDLFIPHGALAGAQHGDRVIVCRTQNRARERARGEAHGQEKSQGHGKANEHAKPGKANERARDPKWDSDCVKVVCVLERATTQIVGYIMGKRKNGDLQFLPSVKRLCGPLVIPHALTNGATRGDAVVVEMTDYDEKTGKVREILPEKCDVESLALTRFYGVEEQFPDYISDAAKAVPQDVPKEAALRREDLRKRVIITIDGADAKDLDDAVSLESLGETWLLGVHIADVSHYINEGTPLDAEAAARATSVYFPGTVAPMLPKELSNGICSLHGGVDRLALTCFMEIDVNGIVIDYRFAETLIRTSARLTYDEVTTYLETKKGEMKRPIKRLLKDMGALASILREKRIREGSIDFTARDTKIEMQDGVPVNVERVPYGVANGIIEEFMLLCNQTVAAHMAKLGLPCLFRVHEEPDAGKVSDFFDFMQSVGYPMQKPKAFTPKFFQQALHRAKETPEELVINKQLMRLMKKARYSEENSGHFGLSFSHYAHFTSPIRRYPDLLLHRALKLWLHGKLSGGALDAFAAKMPALAMKCSEREKNAEEAERAMVDLRKCQYMRQKIGEMYDGVVSGFSNNGIFVELPDSVEGMIPFSSLTDDYFEYDAKRIQAKGERTGRIIRLGDPARVFVTAVDLAVRRVEFAFEFPAPTRPKPATPKAKPKRKNLNKRQRARAKMLKEQKQEKKRDN